MRVLNIVTHCLLATCGAKSVSAAVGWTYDVTSTDCLGTSKDPCGPQFWDQISGASSCNGSAQSPINIGQPVFMDPELESPMFQVRGNGCTSWNQHFTGGQTFEVAFVAPSGPLCRNLSLAYGGTTYVMEQVHFHSPSEHTVGGGYFSAEAHFVHFSEEAPPRVLVLGVFLQETASNLPATNNSFLETLRRAGGVDFNRSGVTGMRKYPAPLNPYSEFLPGRAAHYVYTGSLTTPPCTEGVQWLLYDEPVSISGDDLRLLRMGGSPLHGSATATANGNNNRDPVRPMNGRTVRMSTAVASVIHRSFNHTAVLSDGVGQGEAAATTTTTITSTTAPSTVPNNGIVFAAVAVVAGIVLLTAGTLWAAQRALKWRRCAVQSENATEVKDAIGKCTRGKITTQTALPPVTHV